jgi:hypothetical protein
MTNTTTADPLPAEPVEINGQPAYRVALTGRDGTGEFAIFDGDGLAALRLKGARALYLIGDGKGNRYVAFLRKPSNHTASAARIIVNCPGDRRVVFLNGDRLDLRASNIGIGPRKGETPDEMTALKAECIERRRFSAAMAVRMGRA